MVHFLRQDFNRTIIETSVFKKDLSSAVDLGVYTEQFVIKGLKFDFFNDINRLNNLRRIWWENMPEDEEDPDEFVKAEYTAVAEKWNLFYVTD